VSIVEFSLSVRLIVWQGAFGWCIWGTDGCFLRIWGLLHCERARDTCSLMAWFCLWKRTGSLHSAQNDSASPRGQHRVHQKNGGWAVWLLIHVSPGHQLDVPRRGHSGEILGLAGRTSWAVFRALGFFVVICPPPPPVWADTPHPPVHLPRRTDTNPYRVRVPRRGRRQTPPHTPPTPPASTLTQSRRPPPTTPPPPAYPTHLGRSLLAAPSRMRMSGLHLVCSQVRGCCHRPTGLYASEARNPIADPLRWSHLCFPRALLALGKRDGVVGDLLLLWGVTRYLLGRTFSVDCGIAPPQPTGPHPKPQPRLRHRRRTHLTARPPTDTRAPPPQHLEATRPVTQPHGIGGFGCGAECRLMGFCVENWWWC